MKGKSRYIIKSNLNPGYHLIKITWKKELADIRFITDIFV